MISLNVSGLVFAGFAAFAAGFLFDFAASAASAAAAAAFFAFACCCVISTVFSSISS